MRGDSTKLSGQCPFGHGSANAPEEQAGSTDSPTGLNNPAMDTGGPAGKPFKGIPRIRMSFFANAATAVEKIREFPGNPPPFVRLAVPAPFRVVFASDPEAIEQLYLHKHVGARKSPWILSRVRRLMRQGTFISGGDSRSWQHRRAMSSPRMMRPDAVAAYEQQLDGVLDIALDRVAMAARDGGGTIDLMREIRRLIVDLTFRLFFSVDLGPDLDRVVGWTELLENEFQRTDPAWFPTPRNRACKRAEREFGALAERLIRERRRQEPREADALTDLFQREDPKLGRAWNDGEIRDELFSIYFGASAMATPIIWTTLELSRRPTLREGLRTGPEAADDLDRIIREVTRLYPTFWCSVRYCDRPVTIGGQDFPRATMFVILRYLAHRHPAHWENPDVFDPERHRPEATSDAHPSAHFEYGRGPRACLGRTIAPRIIRRTLQCLLERFDFEYRPQAVNDPQVHFGFGTYPRGSVQMRLTTREAAAGQTLGPETRAA